MAGSTFQTNPYDLSKLLDDCHRGVLQLPDFQRSWVWDEDRIKSLIASISQAFPVGALMTLDTGGDGLGPAPQVGVGLCECHKVIVCGTKVSNQFLWVQSARCRFPLLF